jgi:hypothetical protein
MSTRKENFTRILKLAAPRAGDKADIAVLEYVDRPGNSSGQSTNLQKMETLQQVLKVWVCLMTSWWVLSDKVDGSDDKDSENKGNQVMVQGLLIDLPQLTRLVNIEIHIEAAQLYHLPIEIRVVEVNCPG